MAAACYLGLDIGTSGVRGIVLDDAGQPRAQASVPMPAPLEQAGSISQDPEIWWQAVHAVCAELGRTGALRDLRALAVDGTSGTLLLTDAAGTPLAPALMYHDRSGQALAARIAAVAPPESGAHGATSPLARLVLLQAAHPAARHALHQADWIAGRLLGRFGTSDENNALKLGYDPVARRWPDWLDQLAVRRSLLPEVVPPGRPLGPLDPDVARALGLPATAQVIAGTTDGCASFLATGAEQVGEGVSALGSTLTIKLLSDRPVFAPEFGVYSHRLGERWLAGGASNSGGQALLRFFGTADIVRLTPALRPDQPTGFHWHPLPGIGERFPIADPALRFEPARPADDARFLQGLLEGIADVEAEAYARLQALGAPALRSLRSVGGGAANEAWTRIRAARLGVPMLPPCSTEAAHGAALLAMTPWPAGPT